MIPVSPERLFLTTSQIHLTNWTAVAQTIPRSTPRPHSVDRNRDYYAHDDRSAETIFVEKRHYSRLNHSPKENLAIRQDEYIRKPRQQSRSVNLPKRQVTFNEGKFAFEAQARLL